MPISLCQFLTHVLPTKGTKCWVAIRKTSNVPEIQQGFVNTTEELTAALRHIDGRQWNAFFACATFDAAKVAAAVGKVDVNGRKVKQRSHENALLAKAFWLDIDAGPKKPYPNADAAIEALDAFADNAGLPTPTVVESGNGVHAWWVLDTPLDAATWNKGAALLKELTVRYGLHADPARTADISSILRGPETWNWKDMQHPKEVVCTELMAVVPAAHFLSLLPRANPALTASYSRASVNIGAAMTNIQRAPSEPSYASIAVNHCQQLAHFRNTMGNMEEPLWYANLGVLAHCVDGEQLAHAWSNGHPQYTTTETQAKLEQARNAAGPTTCEKFRDLNVSGCEGCVHRITSPIQLGREQIKDSENFKENSQRERLVEIGSRAELWRDADHGCYATLQIDSRFESHSLKSATFKRWLTITYGDHMAQRWRTEKFDPLFLARKRSLRPWQRLKQWLLAVSSTQRQYVFMPSMSEPISI